MFRIFRCIDRVRSRTTQKNKQFKFKSTKKKFFFKIKHYFVEIHEFMIY